MTDENVATGRSTGQYEALCGYVVMAAPVAAPMGVDSPDVVIAKGLLDHAKLRGFAFWRVAPGEDGPLVGKRVGGDWVDILHLAGFSRDCLAVRQRTSSLILLGTWRASRWSDPALGAS